MKKKYFLMVNEDFYSSGDFASLEKEALELADKARNGFVLPVSGKEIKTVSICMFDISVYNKYLDN